MKLHSDRQDVERSNVASEVAFKIKTTAKAFDILSSGLYTDRIMAVVRELSCNAYDAHVAAGNANPFEIHVPNSLEPWFAVKDSGTGLSDEDVMNLYSTYFDSTKTNSNDYIGALGLGSKSPFSYTKSFEVISRFENVRRMYTVFINEDGVPTIARMGEFPTDEHNGLEVKLAVSRGDWHVFQEKLQKALRWFPVKPNIVGAPYFQWPEPPKQNLSDQGWAMFEKDWADDYSKMTAVQGNVGYKVDISKLDLSDADTHLLENCHVVGFFDIGDLEVAASREEIRYDDRSKKALIKKIKEVRAGILKSVEKRVMDLEAKDTTRWYMMIELEKISKEMFGGYRAIIAEFLKPSKNATIQWYLDCDGHFKLPDHHGHELIEYSLNRNTYDRMKATVKREHVGRGIQPDENIQVFINDMKLGGVAKITHWLRTVGTSETTAVAIRRLEKPNLVEMVPGKLEPKQIEWTAEQFEEEYEKLIEALGEPQMKFASTDAPVPPRSRNGNYKSLPVFQFNRVNNRRYGKSTIVWDRVQPENLDFTTDSLFFYVRNGSQIVVHDSKGEEHDLSWDVDKVEEYLKSAVKLINDAQGTSFTMKNLYAIGSLASKKIKKLPNWVNIFDALKTLMQPYIPAAEYFARCENTAPTMGLVSVCRNSSSTRGNRDQLVRRIGKLDKKSTFRTTLEPIIEDAEKFEHLGSIVAFMKKLDLDLGTKIFDNVNSKPYYGEKAFDDYPMLSFVSQYSYLSTNQMDLFFDYIQTIDRS